MSIEPGAFPSPNGSSSQPIEPSAQPLTKSVRHRLPRRKVKEVWKPLSETSRKMIHEALKNTVSESSASTTSLNRIETRAETLTSKMRVPVGVFSGLKVNSEGHVEMLSLDDLVKKNEELERLVARKERHRAQRLGT